METDELVTVYVAQGEAEETQVRNFLEAHGVPTASWGEALRKTHAMVLDGLGEVQIQVPAEHANHARELLDLVARGELGLAPDEETDVD
jgi:hypothetical protein